MIRTKLAPGNPGFAAQLMGWGGGFAKDHAGTRHSRARRTPATVGIFHWKERRDVASQRRNSASGYDHQRLPATLRQRVLYAAALGSFAVLCGWTVCDHAVTGTDPMDVVGTRGDKLEVAASRSDKLAILKHSFNAFASLFDARFSLDGPLQRFADSPLRADREGAVAPLPRFRAATHNTPPNAATSARNTAAVPKRPGSPSSRTAVLRDGTQASQVDSDKPADRPTLFQTIFAKLFGKPAPVRLAYAATDDGGLSAGSVAARYDQSTAVYDISAHTVYLPDGTRLEAHSGFGNLLDDPNHPDEKMRGVTPPNVYALELRESAFHGVQALRLNSRRPGQNPRPERSVGAQLHARAKWRFEWLRLDKEL